MTAVDPKAIAAFREAWYNATPGDRVRKGLEAALPMMLANLAVIHHAPSQQKDISSNSSLPVVCMQFAPKGIGQWCAQPILEFLKGSDSFTRGFGRGPGTSVGFGTEYGDLYVYPGQWVVKHADGTFSVSGVAPEGVPVVE